MPTSKDTDKEKVKCTFCGSGFLVQGIGRHEKACKLRTADQKADSRLSQAHFCLISLQMLGKNALARLVQPRERDERDRDNNPGASSRKQGQRQDPSPDHYYPEPGPPPSPGPNLADSDEQSEDEEENSAPTPASRASVEIKRIFHPHSCRPPIFQSFSDYAASNISESAAPVDPTPWKPFRTRLDFEVAEFCELAMLNTEMTDTLIKLVRRCGNNIKNFTIENHAELDKLWELSSYKCTKFVEDSITVPYKDEERTFKTHTRPIWDWVLSLVQDPLLAPCFVWDAEKAYRYDGDTYIRFCHEPWTADALWAAQSALPKHPLAKPVGLIIYADKSKLSTFGTEKAYPVIARIANIRVHIRNSTQFGGGQIVGHQPVVKEDAKENNKAAFSTFKNVVWHTAFWKLLESIEHHSKTGSWTKCGDEVLRWLWPMILILASDYEEACVMALIRGLQALYPCPICFVPWQDQSNILNKHPQRSQQDSEMKLQQARACRTAAEREEILKDNSLRDAENVFWRIANSDPHKACSFDRLHAYGGLWTDHIFAQIKLRVLEKGRPAIIKIDEQMSSMPRWRGLNHFDGVMNITFNDGSKNEDIAKMMLFVAHNVLVDAAGVKLLQFLRSFLELNMYVSLEVHTTDTIHAGEHELTVFSEVAKAYIDACQGTEEYGKKNWNFPKIHSHQHVFDDIRNKGASRNFGTKISESMHGPIRNIYHRLTNFKNVTPQLIKHDHRRAVGLFIREQLDLLDAPDDTDCPEDLDVLSNILVGSKQKAVPFTVLEEKMPGDVAFTRFRVRFGDFLSDFLQAHNYNLPNGKRIRFEKDDLVYYDHLGNWTSSADYLRCNPSFHGQSRYDAALVKTTDGHIFVQLIYMFCCKVEKKVHPFALVLPLDIRALTRKDRLLRTYRLQAKPRKSSEFISAHTIIRGVLLAPDFDNFGEYLIVDIADTDISLRLKKLYPDRFLQ
ncbi:hypothetical protein B0H15DRAFT_1002950 [Mycena belliarum]|uniref:Transposase n=1 Tax=Mycena belliarum TaxID=1033014 RepID=A0AAD6UEN4_9AGAR|nr:hypothetical protein B0H15DRAFT_1002950 [Mycena belliae]